MRISRDRSKDKDTTLPFGGLQTRLFTGETDPTIFVWFPVVPDSVPPTVLSLLPITTDRGPKELRSGHPKSKTYEH